VLIIGALVLLAFETVLLVVLLPRSAATWYLLGVVHAAVACGFAYAVNSAFLAQDPRAIGHLRGAWGEEFTRDELERARRKRLIWGWVDSITLKAGDIDHLVVTRTGGLVAIDSKWRNESASSNYEAMVSAAKKAKLRADAIVHTLLKSERGSHRAGGKPHAVKSVVVLWGAAQHEVPDDASIEGIDFVGGGRLFGWLEQLRQESIDEDAAADILQRLESFRSTAWPSTVKP
jgi:hypothetical protein